MPTTRKRTTKAVIASQARKWRNNKDRPYDKYDFSHKIEESVKTTKVIPPTVSAEKPNKFSKLHGL